MASTIKTLAIVQARMGSTRLPDKVMRSIIGVPMIELLLNRLSRAKNIDRIILATSTDIRNEPLVEHMRKLGYEFFQGSENNVLERYYQAAKQYEPENIVRITGDCPLVDPLLVDAVIAKFLELDVDYASNVSPPTYPDGMDVEVMRFSCLKEAHLEAKLPSEREHVTTFLRSHSERFSQVNYAADVDHSRLRWTVDEEEDLEFVESVYQQLYFEKPEFSMEDIFNLLVNNPELQLINSQFERNEGFKKSLLDDELFLMSKD